jgi:uncharacterized membrane protein
LIDYRSLAATAAEADVVVQFLCRPGQFVVKGTTLAVAQGRRTAGHRFQDAFGHTIRIGVRRTLMQDPEFAIAQIVEIALRAMSPGINDPNTAVTCVNWLADGLRELAQCPSRNPVHVDRSGNIRVIESVREYQYVVAAAYDPIRQVARNSSMLTIGMLNAISLIVPFVQAEAGKGALSNQVQLASEGFFSDAVSGDREDVAAAYRRAVQALSSPRPFFSAA